MPIALVLLLPLWLASSAVCVLKGRPCYAVGPVFAAGRLARPESWWARRFYGADKLDDARRRHALLVRGYPR
jgi:hypothetical protein